MAWGWCWPGEPWRRPPRSITSSQRSPSSVKLSRKPHSCHCHSRPDSPAGQASCKAGWRSAISQPLQPLKLSMSANSYQNTSCHTADDDYDSQTSTAKKTMYLLSRPLQFPNLTNVDPFDFVVCNQLCHQRS